MTWKVVVEITVISGRSRKCNLHERKIVSLRLGTSVPCRPPARVARFCRCRVLARTLSQFKCRSILNVYFSGSSLVLLSTSSAEIKRRFKTIVARTEFELNNVSFSCFESYSLDRIKRSATFANRAWIRRRQE